MANSLVTEVQAHMPLANVLREPENISNEAKVIHVVLAAEVTNPLGND